MVPIRRVRRRCDKQWHAPDVRWCFQAIGAVAPKADPLRDITRLVKSVLAGHVGTKTLRKHEFLADEFMSYGNGSAVSAITLLPYHGKVLRGTRARPLRCCKFPS